MLEYNPNYSYATKTLRHKVRRLYQTSESIYYDETSISQAPLGGLEMDYFRYFLEKYLGISPGESLAKFIE
jgi:hypothetical protein